MKNYWPIGILSALGLFVGAMIYTVYLTFQNDYVLESDNYYEKTLVYDEVIEAERAGADFFANVSWDQLPNGDVQLLLPHEVDSATCTLMHPVNDLLDRTVPITLDGTKATLELSEGKPYMTSWRLQLTAYMGEDPVQIRKRWTY